MCVFVCCCTCLKHSPVVDWLISAHAAGWVKVNNLSVDGMFAQKTQPQSMCVFLCDSVFAGWVPGHRGVSLFLWRWQTLITVPVIVVTTEAAGVRDQPGNGAEPHGWMCHSFCVCPSPQLEVSIGPFYAGPKFLTVFCCELAAHPLRMKHQGMCHVCDRPTVTTLFTPFTIKSTDVFVLRNEQHTVKPVPHWTVWTRPNVC